MAPLSPGRSRIAAFVIVVAVLPVTAVNTVVSAGDITPEQVVRELRNGHDRLAEFEARLAVWECEQSVVSNGRKAGAGQITVKRHQDGILGELPTGRICMTPQHFFAVGRSKGNDRWSLLKFQRSDVESRWRQPIEKEYLVYHPLLGQRGEFNTRDMIADPLFLPTAARRIAKDRVELDYEYQLPTATGGQRTKVSGTLTLATDMDWLVVKAVSHAADTPLGHPVGSTLTREVERRGDVLGTTTARLEYVNSLTKQVMNSRVYKYRYASADVDPREFTLDYYQLQAPSDDVYEDRPFNWLLWGGIGVGCIALSLLLAWLVRSTRRAA
jgi:hypothetical protein